MCVCGYIRELERLGKLSFREITRAGGLDRVVLFSGYIKEGCIGCAGPWMYVQAGLVLFFSFFFLSRCIVRR